MTLPKVNVDSLVPMMVNYGLKIVGAVAIWVVGGVAIRFVCDALDKAFSSRHLDVTVRSYLFTALRVTAKIALLLGILGLFGVETASFAAIFAAAGVAIGMAWSGLLANFAAGVFLALLRPFKVGEMISAAGVTGVVKEIGLFATTLTTGDDLCAVVSNNKIFSDNILNYSANPTRRVDLTAQISSVADVGAAIAHVRLNLARIPNVTKAPAPEVAILEFTQLGPVLAVRPHCHNDHYWQVFFDTNAMLKEVLSIFPAPQTQYSIIARSHRESPAAAPRGWGAMPDDSVA